MSKLNVEIYDYFYGKITKKNKEFNEEFFKTNLISTTELLSDKKKSFVIDEIFSHMDFDEVESVRTYIHHMGYLNKHIWDGRDKKTIRRQFENATRHMYSPSNIALAVPDFYKIPFEYQNSISFSDKLINNAHKVLTKEDFGNAKYIITALNKEGILTRAQLYKHLYLGWFYLWTLPNCGAGARMKILMALDKWKEEPNDIENAHYIY